MSAGKIAHYGLLTSLTLVLGFVERQFILAPGLPGMRLGLSNAVLLYALCLLSARGAWLLMGLKVLLSGFLFAGVSGMLYSLAGGVLSMAVMCAVLRTRALGLPGISVAGAVAHMTGQVLMSRLVLGGWAALGYAPVLLAAAVVTGILTGIIAHAVCGALARSNPPMLRRLTALGLSGRDKP